jgi:hypothetical protein
MGSLCPESQGQAIAVIALKPGHPTSQALALVSDDPLTASHHRSCFGSMIAGVAGLLGLNTSRGADRLVCVFKERTVVNGLAETHLAGRTARVKVPDISVSVASALSSTNSVDLRYIERTYR